MIVKNIQKHACLILFSVFLIFYVYTLAPTFLWSDPSKLAVYSYNRIYSFTSSGGHMLHCFLGSLLYLLPLSFTEIAYLQNFLCALYSALALLVIYHTLKMLSFDTRSSIFTIAYLGISHMFWLTSVIYESYALLSLTNAIWIYFLVKWSKEPDNLWHLCILSLSILLGFLNHHITLLYAPFIAIFTIWHAKKHFKIAMYWLSISIILFLLILYIDPKIIDGLINSVNYHIRYFCNFGKSSKQLLENIIIYPGYLFYQFPFLGFFLGISGIFISFKKPNKICFLLFTLFVLMILFWAYYAGGKHPFMHTPVYLFFSFFICIGIDKFYKIYKNKILWLLVFFIIITPVIYYFTPRLLNTWNINVRRNFPYRNANIYYLWPSKRGYYGAQKFAEEALNRINHGGILIADFTIAMPIWYMQTAGKYRQDVQLFLPEYMSQQGSIPGEILWPRFHDFLRRNIIKRGCVWIADKYSIMFIVNYKEGKPITSWDLINQSYKVEWIRPIYKISFMED